MAERNVSAESSETMISPAVADPTGRALSAPLETLRTKTGKKLARGPFWAHEGTWNRRVKRKSRFKLSSARGRIENTAAAQGGGIYVKNVEPSQGNYQ
jgi:predicted outer membrane repeat protein